MIRPALAAFVALGAALCAAPAFGDCLEIEHLPSVETFALDERTQTGETTLDSRGRMVAPVMVNGQGPFGFIVDTGANRSALSRALVDRLGLAPNGEGIVHSVHGQSLAPLVDVEALSYGAMPLPGVQTPVLDGPVLAGQWGLLGVDGMQGRRLKLDFERRCIEILPAASAPSLRNWTEVRGELRFGHLVVVPGRIRGQHVNLLIDTGSDTSLANTALRDQLRRGVRVAATREEMARAYTAGLPVALETAVAIPELSIGELNVRNLIAYVGDYHIFRLWNLLDEPTLLIGMDVLSQSRAVAIDYRTGRVYFRLYRFQTGSRLRQ